MIDPIRATAPMPLDPVPFDIPPAFRTTLPNGLRIVIFDYERLPLVSYRLAFLSGDAHGPKERTGVTSAMMSMITEGTEGYSSLELAEKVERLGGSLSASSSDDFSVVSGSALSMYSSEILQLMSEVVFSPTFPENELDLYRRNTIENLKFQRSQPSFLAGEQTARQLYGDHPYATVSPRPADIERLTREDLESAQRNMFLPNNAVFIAVGDVRKDRLMIEIEDHFGDWDAGDRHSHAFPEMSKRSTRSLTIVDRPGSAQANIVLANVAIGRDHPDYFPLLVMNQILGAGASSRVFMNLREEKGYTYGAYTRLDAKRLGGSFEATAEVRTAVTGESLKEFFFELDRIRGERALEGELDDAKNFLTGVFPIRAETQEGLTNLIVNQELFGLPHDYLQTYRDHIDAVTAEDVLRVANLHIRPDEMSIVIVGDGTEILSQARAYSENIEIFDKAGERKDLADLEIRPEVAPADVAGIWNLALDFQGQQLPVTMTLEQKGEAVTGTLATMLGDGNIADGRITGNRCSATAVTEIQGEPVEFVISGNVVGDSIEGTISAAIIPDSLSFTGTRSGHA
jgi:zinc protease